MKLEPEQSEEYKLFEKFSQTPRYKKLTEGNKAVVENFNPESEVHMQKLRDYLYAEANLEPQNEDVINCSSLRLTKMQIGIALKKCEEYKEMKKNLYEDKVHRSPQATTSRHGYVGCIKGFDASRRVRC